MVGMTSAPLDASAAKACTPRLVLASASPARKKLLEDSGIVFEVRVSHVDEDAVLVRATKTDGDQHTPAQAAQLLAQAKARAVAHELEDEGVVDALVLGCDSVFEFEGTAYGKPYTPQKARERITAMSGKMGTLHTGHYLVDLRPAPEDADPCEACMIPHESELRSARVHFAQMSEQEIEDYVATGEPLQVAGSFTLDGYGAAFIRGVYGEPHAVIGLSVNALKDMLSRLGVPRSALWAEPAG